MSKMTLLSFGVCAHQVDAVGHPGLCREPDRDGDREHHSCVAVVSHSGDLGGAGMVRRHSADSLHLCERAYYKRLS